MYLLLADDLTGGNDAGIQFVKHGIEARLAVSADRVAELDGGNDIGGMLVINANTRNLHATDAGACVRSVIARLRSVRPEMPSMVFKKIDSTLRGNPGAEADAVIDGFGFRTAFLAPAFPQQGRTVVDGILLVNGVPLHQTGFANDPLTPVHESSISALMQKQTGKRIGFVPLSVLDSGKDAVDAFVRKEAASGAEYIIFDAVTREHLATIAEAGLTMENRPLFIGSAGLSEAVASRLHHDSHANKTTATDKADKVLFICGSANQVTHDQIAALEKAGTSVVRMPENILDDRAVAANVASSATVALAGGSAVLASPVGRIGTAGSMAEGLAISAALSNIVLDVLNHAGDSVQSTTLVMTGGETAYAILEHLGTCLSLRRELSPGIALCSITGGAWDGLKVVTKAGGFGTPQTLRELLDILRHNQAA